MKAVVLVGGEGTRLRPLTETIPKPLLPLVDRPILEHVLDHLARHGVDEVLLSSPYLEAAFVALTHRSVPPRVRWVAEPTPLGTGGAVANAARGLDEPCLVLNGDILTDLDLTALVAFHRERGATATIALTRVDDARPYGLVATEGGRVTEFREKPAEPMPGLVNAGTYVLEPDALTTVPDGRVASIEREVFPRLIADGHPVYGFASEAYWMDLGTPEKYLVATFDALEGRIEGLSYTAPHVDPGARVSLRARLGRWVVVGPEAVVEDVAQVEDSVLMRGAVVEEGARVRESILGPGAVAGAGSTVQGSVLAEGARVSPGSETEGARLGPGAVLES